MKRDGTLARETRRMLGKNQAEMAEIVGVHRQTLGKWERGEQRIPAVARRLFRIVAILSDREMLEDVLAEIKNR
jgi:DNA-binding XRE family transcriptional regulator